MSNRKQIKLSQEDLKTIYGDDYQFFEEKIVSNCRCVHCDTPYTSTIVNYEIFLNDLNDIILKGFCAKCNTPMHRYLETGEVQVFLPRITQIRGKYEHH